VKTWQIIALVIIVFLLVGGTTVKLASKKTGGKLVTNAPAGADGVVRRDPAALAREAGTTLPIYALARMLRSEHGSEAEPVKIAVGWAAMNEARARKTTIERLLLKGILKNGKPSSSDGLFGSQFTGKYVTTARDPSTADIEIARKVLSGAVPDPTRGATQFDSPAGQRAALKRGVTGYSKTPEELARDRSKVSDLVVVAGIDPDHLRFWKKRA
jgi:hypothetical protein